MNAVKASVNFGMMRSWSKATNIPVWLDQEEERRLVVAIFNK